MQRNDIGTKLINDPDAKKQIIMFPWINNGEFRDLDASELKDWAGKRLHHRRNTNRCAKI